MSVPSHTHEIIVGYTWTSHVAVPAVRPSPGIWGPLSQPPITEGNLELDDQILFVRVAPAAESNHGGMLVDGRAMGEHIIAITAADIIAGVEKTYTTTPGMANRANHEHEVTITAVDFTAIAAIQLANLAAGIALPRRAFNFGPPFWITALQKTTTASSAP